MQIKRYHLLNKLRMLKGLLGFPTELKFAHSAEKKKMLGLFVFFLIAEGICLDYLKNSKSWP